MKVSKFQTFFAPPIQGGKIESFKVPDFLRPSHSEKISLFQKMICFFQLAQGVHRRPKPKRRETKTKEVRNAALALLPPPHALSTAISAVGMEVAIGGNCSLWWLDSLCALAGLTAYSNCCSPRARFAKARQVNPPAS